MSKLKFLPFYVMRKLGEGDDRTPVSSFSLDHGSKLRPSPKDFEQLLTDLFAYLPLTLLGNLWNINSHYSQPTLRKKKP
ncbi:hypothetical protein TNCV_458751 [Trichonephila clavipes]|nr:hypothetical protein TNCV_458751 [Trichonephila clavipes]